MSAPAELLPPHLQKLADTLPPYLPPQRACQVRSVCRASLYKLVAEGRVRAVKSGNRTLIETWSVLQDLANLSPAKIDPAYGQRKTATEEVPKSTTAATA